MDRKRIVITDLTRMRDFDVCLAGFELGPRVQCIRPLLSSGPGQPTLHPDERWLRSARNQPVRLFSTVSFAVFENRPSPPHTEDWAVSAGPPEVESILDEPDRAQLLESLQQTAVDDLFGAPVHWQQHEDGLRTGGWLQPGQGNASLGTLKVDPTRFRVYRDAAGSTRHVVTFRDERGSASRLSISDLSFRGWADRIRRSNGGSFEELDQIMRSTFRPPTAIWLRIGLARAWARETAAEPVCYLQVTGVHTIPDYLDGAAWYDFRQGLA